MTRNQKEQNARQELGEAHQAQVERTLRDFIDLPADRNRLHLQAGNHEKARQLVERKVGESEGHAPSARRVPRFTHRISTGVFSEIWVKVRRGRTPAIDSRYLLHSKQ